MARTTLQDPQGHAENGTSGTSLDDITTTDATAAAGVAPAPASFGRRSVLRGAGAVAAAIAAPALWIPKARAAGQVVVRTPGGAYDEIRRELIYTPFTKATGIEVVVVPATFAKMMAMVRAGQAQLDVADTGDDPLIQLSDAGALAPIPYNEFKFSDPNDLEPAYKKQFYVGNYIYASVMAYNTGSFPSGKEPRDWAQFWDAKAFPAPRMLADMASGNPNLEFALLADGVPREKLYPLDIDRAFKVMSRIRPSIRKFWDSGALSSQMLTDKEVTLGSAWHTRVQDIINHGAPLAINWNQHMVQVQAYGIFKNAPNMANAKQFVDYCVSSKIQAAYAPRWNCGPISKSAYASLSADVRARIPGGDMTREKGFVLNAEWWAKNRPAVGSQWTTWVLNT